MIETLVLIYGVVIVAGSWLMLKGIAEAPVGYEDEDGFHYLPARPAAKPVVAETRVEVAPSRY